MMETRTREKGTIDCGLRGSMRTLDDVNPTRLSKRSQGCPLTIVEVAQRFSMVGSKRILVIKSLSPGSYSTSHIWRGVLSSSESSACSREGPDQQMLTALASTFFHNARSFRITRYSSHRGGHQFICTSSVCQSTSRL